MQMCYFNDIIFLFLLVKWHLQKTQIFRDCHSIQIGKHTRFQHLGQIRKIPVFRVTRPYLNLLVKPRIFSGCLEKYIILRILKGEMPFKMHKIIFFPKKKNNLKKKKDAYLKFSEPLPKTHLFFYLALSQKP